MCRVQKPNAPTPLQCFYTTLPISFVAAHSVRRVCDHPGAASHPSQEGNINRADIVDPCGVFKKPNTPFAL